MRGLQTANLWSMALIFSRNAPGATNARAALPSSPWQSRSNWEKMFAVEEEKPEALRMFGKTVGSGVGKLSCVGMWRLLTFDLLYVPETTKATSSDSKDDM